MIPKTVWQTYKDEFDRLPDYAKVAAQTWKAVNPGMRIAICPMQRPPSSSRRSMARKYTTCSRREGRCHARGYVALPGRLPIRRDLC